MSRPGFDPRGAESQLEKRALLSLDLEGKSTREQRGLRWAPFQNANFKMTLRMLMVAGILASGVWSLAPWKNNIIRDSSIPIINVDWQNLIIESKTTTTLQVVVNPMLLRNSSIHNNALHSLASVAADYVRFVPWFPYPKLSVPEINAPIIDSNSCTTFWDFTYADPLVEDFFSSTPNVAHIINFSTTPGWMWVLPAGTNYTYPEDINETDFSYNQGTQLRDPTMKEVSDYYARLVSWYVDGGFTDECGVYRHSGHHYNIEYWEVLNEIEAEHSISPEFYNQLYDAIVTAIHEVSPNTKFVGLALGDNANPAYFDYLSEFLDPSKHQSGIPLDFVSYHWYGSPDVGTTEQEAAQCFAQADTFLSDVTQIEAIRKQLSPNVKTTLNEIGTFDPQGTTTIVPGYTIPSEYYVWSGAVYAYVFSGVTAMGIDVIGESQLVGYPSQFPSVSMVNYTTGNPNARLRVLQLIQQNFGPGDMLVQTDSSSEGIVHAQAFITPEGVQKVLLVNKLPQPTFVQIPGFESGTAQIVDLSTGDNVWRTESFSGSTVNLPEWATIVLTRQ
jgi:hypothetical protein